MDEPITVRTWAQFLTYLHRFRDTAEERSRQPGRRIQTLYRGHANSRWKLTTTLERVFPDSTDLHRDFFKYYERALKAKPTIESFSEKTWSLPALHELEEIIEKHGGFRWLDSVLASKTGIREYLVYLRHHGFPSPLLDWTRSPFVAAFFAFTEVREGASEVEVVCLLHNELSGGSNTRHLFTIGPHLRTHTRHYLQQSVYTICVEDTGDRFLVSPHEPLRELEGEVVKIKLPVEMRTEALGRLEEMNINEFSLFGSEDSLIRTVARREFKDWKL